MNKKSWLYCIETSLWRWSMSIYCAEQSLKKKKEGLFFFLLCLFFFFFKQKWLLVKVGYLNVVTPSFTCLTLRFFDRGSLWPPLSISFGNTDDYDDTFKSMDVSVLQQHTSCTCIGRRKRLQHATKWDLIKRLWYACSRSSKKKLFSKFFHYVTFTLPWRDYCRAYRLT